MIGLLLLLAAATGPTGPSGASAPAPAARPAAAPAAPASPLVAAARKAQAAGKAPMASQRVWTLEDLEKLDRERPGSMNVVAPTDQGTIPVIDQVVTHPQGVEERYRELLTQADAEIAKLERERMASTNPLLRGLAPESPRTADAIDADLAKWRQRRDDAAKGLGDDADQP